MIYDELYRENSNYFGNPFPEVIGYFRRQPKKGKVLDVGCGQGRNAIPLAEMGYQVLAIDTSHIAINQLREKVKSKTIDLNAKVVDWCQFNDFTPFDHILLDGFFHFYLEKKREEERMMQHLLSNLSSDVKVVFCFADHEDAVSTFREMTTGCTMLEESKLEYTHADPISEWTFETKYFFAILTK